MSGPSQRQVRPSVRGRFFDQQSSQVVGLRDRVVIIRALLHAISFPQPYAGYGDVSGVGRRRSLSEAACCVPEVWTALTPPPPGVFTAVTA